MAKSFSMEASKKVGLWIRVSTDFQVKDDSPEHHEERARLYAKAKGWDVVEVYRLDALSGKSVMEYLQTKKMLADIRSGKITGLIFSKLARLARNTKELLEFADIFREYNADLVSLAESIDTSSPAGRLFYTMIAAMAEWERAEIADRVAASVPIRAKMGKPLGGQASFGFKWQGKELVADETEAPIRRQMYEIFAQCKRKKATAAELNKRGFRTRNGSPFSDTTVGRLLRDPSAKGERRANYTKSSGEGKKWELKSAEDWVIVPCPQIVSPELWDECNAILDQQERTYTRAARRPQYLLTGFVTCHCSGKMAIKHSNEIYTCKECKNRIPAADLDEIYHLQLKSFLVPEQAGFANQFQGKLKETEKLYAATKEQETILRGRTSTLLNLRLNEEIDKDSFAIEFKPLEQQLRQIENELPRLEAEVDFLKVQALSSDTVLQEASDLYEQWHSLSFEQRRAIVEVITESITIGKQDITIKLGFLPATPLSQTADFSNTAMPLRIL